MEADDSDESERSDRYQASIPTPKHPEEDFDTSFGEESESEADNSHRTKEFDNVGKKVLC